MGLLDQLGLGGKKKKSPSKTKGGRMYREEQRARKEGNAHSEFVKLVQLCKEYRDEHGKTGNGAAKKAAAMEQARIAKKAGVPQAKVDELFREAGIRY